MQDTIVSLIIPIHDAELYLRDCLDSAINQTLHEIEIIAVDDCSTDASASILAEYAQRDARVKPVYYSVHKTASQARKDGVALAKGKFIMFMDSDDSLEPDACEKLSAQMEERDVDILQFGTYVEASPYVRREAVEFFHRFVTPCTQLLKGEHRVFDACFKDKRFRFSLWNKIYRSELCKRAFAEVKDGFYPKAQDLYAFFILAWYADSYYGIEDKYYHYKYGRGITGGGRVISMDTFRRHCSQHTVALECQEFLKSQGAWEEYGEVWEDLNRSLAGECVGIWFRQLPDEECGAGFDELADRWGLTFIGDRMKESFGGQLEQVIAKARGSRYSIVKALKLDAAEPEEAVPPEGFLRVIPVVFATNDLYAPFVGTAIESIMNNADPQDYYRIYVLHTRLSEAHIRMLNSLGSDRFTVRCINVDLLIGSKQVDLAEKAHITRETYLRFVIPEVCGVYPYVIYLDCDLIVHDDLANIIPSDMGDNLIAAVRNRCIERTAERLREDFDLDAAGYINAGVMVINVAQWKKESTEEACFEAMRTIPSQKLAYQDQDVLNIVCRNRIYYLDESWNLYWHMLYGDPEYVSLCRDIVQRIGDNFRILHFASHIKPWTSPELPHSRYFWEAARQSPFYEEILRNNILRASDASAQRQMEALAERNRQLQFDLDCIHNSVSFRIGRAVTWLPRKLRGGVHCFQEHGFRYTFDRGLIHLRLKEDPEHPKNRDYAYYSTLPARKYPEELRLWYKQVMGEDLDLRNPRTFNEKIQWMKLYDATPLKTRLADKYLVREWVKEKIGEEYLIPLLGVWDSFDEIDFDKLPDRFVLKANHGSGWNIIVKDKAAFDRAAAKNQFDEWMQTNFAFITGFELQYMNIPPKIIAEEYMENLDQLFDYKVWCSDGKARFIWVDTDRYTGHKRTLFSLDWVRLPITICELFPVDQRDIPRPKNLEKMIRFAELMCKDFAQVRVDFYEVDDKLYFGEMTFTSGSGLEHSNPRSFENEMGDWITLPPKSPIPRRKKF